MKKKGIFLLLILNLIVFIVGCGNRNINIDEDNLNIEEESKETKVFRDQRYTAEKKEDTWEDKGDVYYKNLYDDYFYDLKSRFPNGMVITKSNSENNLKTQVAKSGGCFYYQTYYKDIKSSKWMYISIYINENGLVYLNDGKGRGWIYTNEKEYPVNIEDIEIFNINIIKSSFRQQVEKSGTTYDLVDCTDGRVNYIAYIDHRTENIKELVYKDEDVIYTISLQSISEVPKPGEISKAKEVEARVFEWNDAFYLIEEIKDKNTFSSPKHDSGNNIIETVPNEEIEE